MKKMKSELIGIYSEDFKKVKRYVERHCNRGAQRDEALQNLCSIYLDAQEHGEPLEELRGESAEEYAREIAAALPPRKSVRWQKALKPLTCVLIAAAVCFCVTFALIRFTSDSYAIQSGGLSFLNANPQKFIYSEQDDSYSAFYSNGNSSFTSYFYFNKDGSVIHGGYANNYGVFFENIIFSENYEAFSIDVKVNIIHSGDDVYELNTPVKPVFAPESGELLYFIKSPVTAQAKDCRYKGTVSHCYVDSAGWVRFHIDFVIDDRNGSTDLVKYITSGQSVDVFFEKIFTLKWRRILGQTSDLSFENLRTFPEQYPVYDTEHVVYYTEDGRVAVVMDLVLDSDDHRYIEIAHNELICLDLSIKAVYDDPSYSFIDENGAVHRKLSYSIQSGEIYTDEATFVYNKN